jgi:membrane protease YdiL (CAAX protease family)
MSQFEAIALESSAASSPRKGRPLLAWLVVVAIILFTLWRSGKESTSDKEKYDLTTATIEGRLFVGLDQLQQRFSQNDDNKAILYAQSRRALDQHTYAERLRFVVVAGELMGPAEARKQLDGLNERYRQRVGEPSTEDAETAQLLERLYSLRERKPSALGALSQRDREELLQRLGWFGALALTPEQESDSAARAAVLAPAIRTAIALPILVVFMFGLAFFGLILLVTMGVLWFLQRLPGGLSVGSAHGGIYAETFALYMLVFLGFSVAGHYAVERWNIRHGTIALSGAAALLSLIALGWPVLRGVSWGQVRRDIGWTGGRRPWLEPLFGVGGYALALSMLPFALIATMIATTLRDQLGAGPSEFGPSNAPGHPIVFSVAQGGWWVWLQVFFVACVVAPLVEETMFRGVLYRHLREAGARRRPAVGVLVSALVVSFVFAVIHPQGLLAVPPLMSLAMAFALMREWRVSLLPAMVAHGLNNAVATLLLFLTLS